MRKRKQINKDWIIAVLVLIIMLAFLRYFADILILIGIGILAFYVLYNIMRGIF